MITPQCSTASPTTQRMIGIEIIPSTQAAIREPRGVRRKASAVCRQRRLSIARRKRAGGKDGEDDGAGEDIACICNQGLVRRGAGTVPGTATDWAKRPTAAATVGQLLS